MSTIMEAEPRYKIQELVSEIIGRRDEAVRLMQPELNKLVVGLIDQFSAMKKHNPDLELSSVKFERIRWSPDGKIIVDVFHNRRRFTPADAGW